MGNFEQKAFDWTGYQLGYDIWNKKYRFNGESFDEWLDRVSGGDLELKELIQSRKFLFGGRTLAARGTGNGQSFSNCYSSGYAPDSVEGMLELNKKLALTYKASGGQGLSLSLIRPKGSPVKGGVFKSDGIVPFMEIFNQTTASISQGGARKGALMMSLSVWHPEIETFISIKDGTGMITKANLSVEVDDEFMQLVKDGVTEYTYVNSVFGTVNTVNPTDLYNKIMKRAWSSAEPGIIFTERFRNYNFMEKHDEYKIITSNPCGEQPLPAHGACNLGSINMAEYVKKPFTKDAQFDLELFSKDVMKCIVALDNVLEEGKDLHALPEQREMAKNYRNIGLGIMGYGTALMSMGIAYGSHAAKIFTDGVMYIMLNSAVHMSSELAKIKGAFPKYDEKILEGEIFKHITEETMDNVRKYGLRNCSLLSVAPSGSIGTALNISTGLEPYYSLSYQRKTESLHGDKDVYYTVEVDTAKKAREIFGDAPCVSAMDVDWRDRVEIQGIMQKYIDTAISSTVNVPEDTSVDELRDLYLFAWEQGLKGITIYREGSFEAILSSKPTGEKVDPIETPHTDKLKMADIPNDTVYVPKKLVHGCGELKVMIGYSKSLNKVTDVYIIPKMGQGCSKNIVGQAVLMSQILRLGGDLNDIKTAVSGIDSCTSYYGAKLRGKEVSPGVNCPSGLLNLVISTEKELIAVPPTEVMECVGDVVRKYETPIEEKVVNDKIKCPECGNELSPEGGCFSCPTCGFSKCG